jgi:hypothetical protein
MNRRWLGSQLGWAATRGVLAERAGVAELVAADRRVAAVPVAAAPGASWSAAGPAVWVGVVD